MVIVFAAQVAETPAGKPLAPATPSFEIPVANVVVWVIAVRTVLIHRVGVADGKDAVMAAVTVMVPVALTTAQPPVSVIL
jgi:hypothetical protein